MNDPVHAAAPATSSTASRPGLALLLGALPTAALVALAVFTWRQQAGAPFAPGPLGVRYAVQLQNGQMFYGVLREIGARHVQMEDVYYVQPFTQPDGSQGNRVVNRQKNDWHGPQVLTVPLDKVVTIETVSATSQLAKLIEQEKAAAPAR